MPRTARSAADRWPSKKHGQGYCKPVGKAGREIAWMFYSQDKKSTGLRWIASNRVECVTMLDTWIDALKSDPAERRRWRDVQAEYEEAYVSKQPKPVQRSVGYAFDAYFPPDSDAADRLPFRYKDLRDYLTTRHDQLARTHTRDTIKAYRSTVSRLFRRYAIGRDYIDRDPTAALERNVGAAGKVDVQVWSYAEVELIARQAAEPVGLWYRWQYLTGMRPSESARMRWEDFTPGGLTIYGAAKGAAKKGDIVRDGMTLRPRAFVVREPRESDSDPVAAWMAAMVAVIDRMRALTGSTEHVWTTQVRMPGMKEANRVRERSRMFHAAAVRAGVEAGGRRFYDLRASAGDAMEERGLDDQLISDLSGHDKTMRMNRYRPARNVERLERRLPGK
jgi:integrase